MAKINLIKPSTRAFWREARSLPGYSLLDFLHGYVYGRWPYLYISLGTGRHPLSRRLAPLVGWLARAMLPRTPEGEPDLADSYHGKAVPLETARQLVSVKEDLRMGDLEKVIPYRLARDLILQHPEHIAVLDCPCRAAAEYPCLPLDVCLIVGEPFASFIVEHRPDRARRISAEEAQAILEAEDKRGHVHHAFFKDAMLGRFYAICNCCSCCCGAMHAQRNGIPMLASSGYVARVGEDCTGCGSCKRACLFDAVSVNGRAVIDPAACMGCGICLRRCPAKAIQLELAPERGEPLVLPVC